MYRIIFAIHFFSQKLSKKEDIIHNYTMFDFGFVDSWTNSEQKNSKEDTKSQTETPQYIGNHFRLPIAYLPEDEKHELSPIIAKDLELDSGKTSMYRYVFDISNHEFAEEVMPQYQTYFTTNTEFLQDSQEVIQNIRQMRSEIECIPVSCTTIQTYWTHVKHDPHFLEKYGYLDWSILKSYNKSSVVLQSICLANMLSPLSSFIIPILFFIFPFVILKIQGIPISFEMYLTVLQSIAQNHFIGKAINGFQTMAFDKLIYVFGMIGLYFFQMYQNIVQCIRFYNNIERVNKELYEWKEYIQMTIRKMKSFLHINGHIRTYQPFCSNIRYHLEQLEELYIMLEPICLFECSLYKITEIGYLLRCYYELYDNPSYEDAICFSMGFEGYLQLMYGLEQNLYTHVVHCAEFQDPCEKAGSNEAEQTEPSDDEKTGSEKAEETDAEKAEETEETKTVVSDDTVVIKEPLVEEFDELPDQYIMDQYYPPLKDDPYVVKNDANLDAHNVITGPNASGKTTFLKTTALNIIFSQQLGIGFYDSCCLVPYTHLHSYLNIPDTSGRDSLFQAESRRCKDILDSIAETPEHHHHFCIFDELYSGTNPEEATKAAYAFMTYISAKTNVKLLLTTHYVSICDQWKNNTIENYQMEVLQDDEQFEYTYKIQPGVSKVHGAIHILEQMDYPKSILDAVK